MCCHGNAYHLPVASPCVDPFRVINGLKNKCLVTEGLLGLEVIEGIIGLGGY